MLCNMNSGNTRICQAEVEEEHYTQEAKSRGRIRLAVQHEFWELTYVPGGGGGGYLAGG